MEIMTSLLNILWIFFLPFILIISIDISSSSISLKEFYVLISSAITHSITYTYISLSTLSNHRKQIFLVITSLLHLNILCFYVYHILSYLSFLTGLYLSYIIIPILINCLQLIKLHKKQKYDNINCQYQLV